MAIVFPVTLPDLVTIHHATGVANVDTYVHVFAGAFPTGDRKAVPAGPTAAEREASPYHASVEVIDADGTIVRSVLHTVNGYTFTAIAAAHTAQRVLAGETRPGFQTPVGLFGRGFAETIATTTIVDL
ncbi:saccharopine dehydrogenase family protein [Rhizobium halophilum]|uniref:hypothetical protein n=1 Tax=Rhizobium halophilum TaxID=2846852 RepID=UPI001EFDF46D|nr:hypothetical protein [Rhizobium halophilum]MCF6367597.1 hypothetical protein [Rhizobium halophilum]